MVSIKQEFKLLWKFYLFFFLLAACSFVVPFWIIYLNQVGLSYLQISLILGLSLLASVIFEVPTGAIADVFGRKLSMLLGLAAASVCLLLIPFFSTFSALFLIFFISAASQTLISGADEAWFVDYLKQRGGGKLLHTAFARLQTLAAAGATIAFILGALFVEKFGIRTLWWLQGGAFLLIAIYALLAVDEKFTRQKAGFRQAMSSTFESAKSGAGYVRKHPVLFWLILGVFFGSLAGVLQVVWQPFLISVGLLPHQLGYLFAVGAAIGIVAPLFSTRLLKLLKTEKTVLIFREGVCFALLFIIALIFNLSVILALYIAIAFIAHATAPITGAYFQKHVPSETRATISSLRAWVGSVGGFVVLVFGGYAVDVLGLRAGLLMSALAGIPVVICYLMIKEKSIKAPKSKAEHGQAKSG